jgi:integrase
MKAEPLMESDILQLQGQRLDGQGESMARRRYQRGYLYLRGKKTSVWVGRWREDVMRSDGLVQRIRRSFVIGTRTEIPTRRLAERRFETMLSRVNSPSYRPGRVATFAEFADRWRTEVLIHRKPSGARAAESHLRCHILPLLGKMKLEDLGLEVQQTFVTRLAETVSSKTAANVTGTLSVILSTAKNWGYICEPVDFGKLVMPSEEVKEAARFFTADEARLIIATAGQPFRTIFAIAAMTGMRVGELLALQTNDLDFERKIIHVRRSVWHGQIQTVKSKASRAPVPMPDALSVIIKVFLESWQPNPAKFLFLNRRGRPYSANKVVQKALWPLLEKLNIPKCGLHAFRHMHSSLLLETGASPAVAQAQLRHSDARITLGVYGHVIGDSQRTAVEKVAKLLAPSGPKSEFSGELIQ